MVAINATVYPDEAYVLVQADWSGTILRDSFERVATQTWEPSADTGQVYAVQSGAAADFPVNGTQGVIIHSAVNTTKRLRAPIAAANIDATGVFYNATVPTGNDFIYQTMGRFVDINNLVDVRFTFAAAGTVSVTLREIIAGVAATSTAAIAAMPTSGVFRWRFVADGTLLSARLWQDGTPEPTTWNLTFTTAHLSAGDLVTGTVVNAGVTNPTPITFFVDDLVVVDPTAATTLYAKVTRRNTVTGEIVTLRPYTAYDDEGALLLECGLGLWWDTEPPLNVALEYCAVAADVPTMLTQNRSFDTTTAPWTATNGALTQDCTVAKVGTCSGRLTPTGGLTASFISQAFTMNTQAGVPFTVSAWVMSPQGWNSTHLEIVVTYADASTVTFKTPIVALDDNEWRFMSGTFIPAQNISTATVYFIATGEPPNTVLFNLDEFQVTQDRALTASACETVTVPSESVWLKSPLHPCLDVEIGLCNPALADCEETARVSYAGVGQNDFAPNTVLLDPANRERPLPVNRIRRDPGNTLRLVAHNCDARDAVVAINKPGDPLLFQAPADYCITDRYISVGVLSEAYLSIDQREDFRLMVLPYVVVDRPQGPADGVCGARITDLCDIYTSWAAFTIAGLTWTDLLLGLASPDGPGQPAPPEDARTWDDVEAEFADWTAVLAAGTRDWDEVQDGL